MTRRRFPATLLIGVSIILVCEILLFTDVFSTGRPPLHTQAGLEAFKLTHPPTTPLTYAARWVAVNMTALVWIGYIFLLDGLLLYLHRHSPVRSRPHHFAMLCLASVFIWCVFDWVNFYSIRAWRYVGMPPTFAGRVLGYLVAFGAIVPGMLLSGQILLNLRVFKWAATPTYRRRLATGSPMADAPSRRFNILLLMSLVAGVAMFLWPFLHPDPITNLTLWASLVFLLDPINYWLGRPSMWRDWRNGWFGRTLAAFAGGLVCGFLWEFWNYWALTKWVYHLPFLGSLEHIRYFEMPVLGLLGFLPFGLECWVMWQTLRIPLDGLVEPLPSDHDLL
ncbi:MAG TPA: hypothetical protein VHP11_04960 [Tepidisphaeraceae bacterium]|nr:hypothetical protein [Tepidisphaeraceae bacterium]